MRKKISSLNQSADKVYQSRTMRFIPKHILCSASYRVLTPIIRLILLTLVVTTFGGLLSGCHPCSIPGVCQPPFSTEEIVAFTGKDGAIYFDIPARKNYKRTELSGITIYRVDVGEFAIPYWGISKRGYTYEGKLASQAQDLPLPLRYGQEGALTERNTQPKAIENGKYRISGAAWLYNEKGQEFFQLYGHFRYENGTVYDYSTK